VNFTHAYSPASGEVRYDFGFHGLSSIIPADPREDDLEFVASWMGLPGRALGGMDPSIQDTNPLTKPYDFSANLHWLTGVPIPAASSKSLVAQLRAKMWPRVAAKLRTTKGGALFQDSSLTWNAEYALPGAYLLHDRWVYRLGDLQPGDVVQPATKQRRSAASKFRRHRKVDGQEVATPFDLGTLDTLRVVEAMLFHEAAGGASYTAGLENRYLNNLDMSGLLRSNVAILVGQPKDAILKVDFHAAGEERAPPVDTRHLTILRIVLPVEIVER
jgi:hypothetical protein